MIETLEPSERTSLRQFLISHFSLSDLKDLAFDLGVGFQFFPHQTTRDFARELIAYLERRTELSCLVIECIRRRPVAREMAALLNKLPVCSSREMIIIIVRSKDLLESVSEFRKEFASKLQVPEDDVVVVGTARGSMRLLISIPQKGADLSNISKINNLGNGKYQVSISHFDSLDSVSRRAWRLVAHSYLPIHYDDVLRPTVVWQDALKQITKETQFTKKTLSKTSTTPTQKLRFGADGIRGIAGEWPLRSQDIAHIGDALGRFVMRKSNRPLAVIGRDTRPSGEAIVAGLKEGLMRHGVHVLDIGIMTTPGIAYIVRRDSDADLGVIVTASHNPASFNGVKLLDDRGLRLQTDAEVQIEQMFLDPIQTRSTVSGQAVQAPHLAKLYIQDHVDRCPAASLHGLRLTLDCANGATRHVAPEVFRRLGAEVTNLNDGRGNELINEACGSEDARRDPSKLVNLVRRHQSAYGLAFDGDGDRLIIVDADGNFFNGDDFLYILATYFYNQERLRENTIVTTNIANSGLKEALQRSEIKTVETQNGDKYLEARMWSSGYLLGGEQVGNIIINDGYHTAADPLYAAVTLFGILQNQKTTLQQLVTPLQKRPQALASVKLDHIPSRSQGMLELHLQIDSALETLGAGSKILTWESGTEAGHFKIMVEGTLANTFEEVSTEARNLCQVAQQIASTVSISAPSIMRLG